MKQFTPGIFTPDKNDDNGETVIRTTDGRIVANLECDAYNLTAEEIEANANLFAASKDLYEALKNIYDFLNTYSVYYKDGKSIFQDIDMGQMFNALNKANGK